MSNTMRYSPAMYAAILATAIVHSPLVTAHGLMESPPSRNALCGVTEKPDNATSQHCIDAFANDFNGGYQFMSVLTHDVGRTGVSPLPAHVCGFGSETWQGGPTPWDTPTTWPTTSVQPGPIDITWNISWGPHFDDTEEFRYWITKPDFQFDPTSALSWDDFEATEFCTLTYDDKQPDSNPNVIPDKAGTRFTTKCSLPARNGHHIVYGEWGRNLFTFERFHGCIDVSFNGGPTPPQALAQSVATDKNTNVAIALGAVDSDGTIVSYNIESPPSHGRLSGTGANRTYLPNADYVGPDSFSFSATDNDNLTSSPATVSVSVQDPSGNAPPQAQFDYSAVALSVTFDASASSDADGDTLSYAWDFGDGNSASGIGPVYTYASPGSYLATLTVSDGAASTDASQNITVSNGPLPAGKCEYVIQNSWNNGFVAAIRIHNTGTNPINGWQVAWEYNGATRLDSSWNATLDGSNPYTAINLGWNATIDPGTSVEFGVQGSKTDGEAPEIPSVTGDVCQ